MRLAILVTTAAFAACSGSGPRADTFDGPLPDMFTHEYEYSGILGTVNVAGRVSFEESADKRVRYTVEVDGPGIPCRGYLRSVTQPDIRLGCQGLTLEFVRMGEVADPLLATLRTTQRVDTRECGRWQTNPTTGQRVCIVWETVSVDQPVTYRGSLSVRRVRS